MALVPVRSPVRRYASAASTASVPIDTYTANDLRDAVLALNWEAVLCFKAYGGCSCRQVDPRSCTGCACRAIDAVRQLQYECTPLLLQQLNSQ